MEPNPDRVKLPDYINYDRSISGTGEGHPPRVYAVQAPSTGVKSLEEATKPTNVSYSFSLTYRKSGEIFHKKSLKQSGSCSISPFEMLRERGFCKSLDGGGEGKGSPTTKKPCARGQEACERSIGVIWQKARRALVVVVKGGGGLAQQEASLQLRC